MRPGDDLTVRVTILEADRSRSKPDRGLVRSHVEVLNQHRRIVMSLKAMNILRCRAPERVGGIALLPPIPGPRAGWGVPLRRTGARVVVKHDYYRSRQSWHAGRWVG